MGIHLELHHRTAYRYERAVSLGPQVIQLRPSAHCKTPIHSYTLELTPADHILNWQFDPLGNHLARVILSQKTTEFLVDVTLVADMTPVNPFAFFLEPGFETYPFQYPTETAQNLEPYRSLEPVGPRLRAFLGEIPAAAQNTVTFVGDLTARVRDRVGYVTRMEHGVQSCEQTLAQSTGSCRDSAWLLVQVFRSFGLAARFVSGYLLQLAADKPEHEAGPKVDSADLHAWAEVFLPGAGWIGVDATSGLFTAEGHIPLVCTPSPSQAAPISGTVEPAPVEFSYSFVVRRLNETPSLTKPFSDEEWARVRAVAHAVDRDLQQQDVRLTMGGEPTFVGIDEPESPQWNLEALGAIKRTRGLMLIRRLRERTAPGGLLHFGQGKWYPGEPLPRWAFHCISRADGIPVWENADLIAREDEQTSFGLSDGLRFLQALARRLQVTEESILAAYEPASEADEREQPTGYLLPLRRRQPEGRLAWSSQLWFDRPDRLVLFPGDSPIGYRILAELMPFVAPDELVHETELYKGTELVKLPDWPARRPELFGMTPEADPLPPLSSTADTAPELVRPALCVQAVAGRLHVFLPYTPVVADYLDLVAAVEDTCAHLGVPIWLEGYSAPYDPRLRTYGLTPDPGVLEVNLPPTANWDDLEELNAVLHEEAHGNRLIAGKFAYDGGHLSTGGGSHIVLGSTTVLESPVLRRPDVLRSMVTFWQRHPSLSYLFSGMYVGPTSQYPRVDEARVDALYELEVAFSQLTGDECPPYILDGLFRNLLVDVTGNTHRAEFCIDKMYPPEGQGLRAGLLELRAFEMPPHFRMGLLQMLLVRALVGAFWRQPFTEDLIRWEATLHDRFMLPHFVHDDFTEVLRYLRAAGFAFEDDWFRTHLEFRFPKIGSLAVEGIELELRQALEPWNVLAEETNSGRTGRSVDSSLERMQLKMTGLTGKRFVVACNGRRVPLTPTGKLGESIAGIRYRARRLSAALHPTIPVHTPLVFDLIDTWKGRSVGRCTYFAGPPDGTVHTSRPRDAEEAKARRLLRFQVSDPPSEPMHAPAAENNPIFPMTLDLRFPAPGAELTHDRSGVCPVIGDLYQSTLRYGATYEESSADGVSPRPQWAPLMESLHTLGPVELGRRWALAERRIRENGITYNIYGDPQGMNRPWQTDVVPLLISEDEWTFIEAGIIQRAELLSRLLQDLYGAQNLLKEGHFPAALLYGNPAFLRPMVGVAVPQHSYLHMLAVDLARSPDGQWWVLADRTQAPSGSGYAVENRTIVSDLLPELFRTSNVRRLAPFFRSQRDALIGMAGCENPRVVLHTPGPHNETYFEHSYLAKYLGFTLVVGADMTVRDRRVYLKTVGGLEQVDVILRRVDDGFCDPLELRGDSLLGVPGLVDAIVAGNVVVANALGSGLIESAAIMPFLPGLSRHLLGEELKLPSVATWWCGQPRALDWVLNHLESVVVKPAFPSRGMEPMFGSELPEDKRAELIERLRAFPHEYVAQEQVALSTAPVWENDRLNPRSMVLRTYVLHTATGWVALPGGLVRVSEADGTVVSMQRGGHSKDAWVLSNRPVDTFSMLPSATEPLELRRASRVVPSGVADNTFWLGRYVERAENMARILRSIVLRVRRGDETELASLVTLHRCLGSRQSKLPKSRRKLVTFTLLERELISMMTNMKRWDSLPCTLGEIARIGGNVRERLSADMMLLIGQLRTSMKSERSAALPEYSVMLTECLELLSAFSGMERENLIRGSGWLFMSLGRRLERAIYLTRQLREITKPLTAENWPYLEYLLEVADSSVTYRTRYYTTLQPLAVMDVLMLDETNPRSLEFQLDHLVELYEKLPRYDPSDLETMKGALALLRGIDLQSIVYPALGKLGPRDTEMRRLDRYLADLEDLLPSWSNNLSSRYFSHARTLPITMGQ